MSSEKESAADDVNVVRSVWAAIALEDVHAVLAMLDPQVRWHGAGDGEHEAGCRNRDEVLAFLQRSHADGVSATLLEVHPAGKRLVAVVQTHLPAEWGNQPEPHGELVTVRDGKIVEILVYATVPDALAAAHEPGST